MSNIEAIKKLAVEVLGSIMQEKINALLEQGDTKKAAECVFRGIQDHRYHDFISTAEKEEMLRRLGPL